MKSKANNRRKYEREQHEDRQQRDARSGNRYRLIRFELGGGDIAMTDALMAGGFCKGVFLPVDASIWINNIFKGKDSDVR